MSKKKQIVESTDWLTRGYSAEELARMKAEAIKEAEAELREKQIEEIAKIFCGMKNGCDGCMWGKTHCDERNYAEEIYNAGYRKQSEGEWIENEDDFWVMCSECGTEFLDDQIGIVDTYKHCPNCGAKMKGGAEE